MQRLTDCVAYVHFVPAHPDGLAMNLDGRSRACITIDCQVTLAGKLCIAGLVSLCFDALRHANDGWDCCRCAENA